MNKRLKGTAILVIIFLILFVWIRGCEEAEAATTFEVGPVITKGDMTGLVVIISEVWSNKYALGFGLLAPEYLEDQSWEPFMLLQAYRHVNWKFVTLGLGAAYWQNRDEAQSRQFTFTELIRFRLTRRVDISYRHWSNGGAGKKGFGEDALMLGIHF